MGRCSECQKNLTGLRSCGNIKGVTFVLGNARTGLLIYKEDMTGLDDIWCYKLGLRTMRGLFVSLLDISQHPACIILVQKTLINATRQPVYNCHGLR